MLIMARLLGTSSLAIGATAGLPPARVPALAVVWASGLLSISNLGVMVLVAARDWE